MSNPHNRIQVGRVIFRRDAWIVQTLDSHVGNVVRLAQEWDHERAFQGALPPQIQRTREKIIDAARVHDMAKPEYFGLTYKAAWHGKPEWGYSFAGHRFNAFHPDSYTETLAQLHHTFSVDEITQRMARLKLDSRTAPFAVNLPLDLYALEMCDQIEATMARTALESSQPEERVFMDFQFRAGAQFEIEPFPFQTNPLTFQVEYVELVPPLDKQRAVENAPDGDERKRALREMQGWLVDALNRSPVQSREVTITSWTI